jgi:hypothetical protein
MEKEKPPAAPQVGVPISGAGKLDGEHANDLAFLRERVKLVEEDDRKAADAVDRIVLFGGPAALLASITFLKDLAATPAIGTTRFLVLAWFLLLIGSLFAMVSLFTARATARRYRRLLERKVAQRETVMHPTEYDEVRRWNTWTVLSNRVALVVFFLGIGFLVAFAMQNLPPERQSPMDTASRTAARNVSTRGAEELLRQCLATRCVGVFGYDYDLSLETKPQLPLAAPNLQSQGEPK